MKNPEHHIKKLIFVYKLINLVSRLSGILSWFKFWGENEETATECRLFFICVFSLFDIVTPDSCWKLLAYRIHKKGSHHQLKLSRCHRFTWCILITNLLWISSNVMSVKEDPAGKPKVCKASDFKVSIEIFKNSYCEIIL